MGNFKAFLIEEKNSAFHAELHIHPHHPPIVHIYHGPGPIDEKQYNPKEHDHLHGEAHKMIGEFKPSKLDHHTITKEFHEHLHKHGFYAFAPSHPLVLSPKEQKFKQEFKHRALGKTAKYEKPHHDGGFGGKGTGQMGRFTAVWSTKGPTKIYHNDNKEIHGATQPHHVTVFNDQKVKHSASGENDRWFVRAGEIKKIPKAGLLMRKTKAQGGGVHRFGNDIHSFIKAKKASAGGPRREVQEFHLKHQKRGTTGIGVHKETMDWIKKEHPEFHPDHKD